MPPENDEYTEARERLRTELMAQCLADMQEYGVGPDD